jgi:YrbI family 3-deoxy-D-manno-octulosonate 8-phosphate phosphatase
MKKIAFIPVRCGSKSIPLKNIEEFCGKPLVYWVVNELEKSETIDEIVIATDCREIIDVVKSFTFKKINIYIRKPINAQDSSSTESVMLEYINQANLDYNDYLFLVQATSPFTRYIDFDTASHLLTRKKADSLLSCARVKKFLWNEDGKPINYNYTNRPRRQKFKGTLVENGAFYINKVANIIKYKNRLSGKIVIYEMPEFTSIELDEPDDWIIAEIFMKKYILNKGKLNRSIKLFAFDVDGVLTDGGMYYSKDGEIIKKFNTKDGMGIDLIKKEGIIPVIITREDSDIILRRAEKLGIEEVYINVKEKLKIIKILKEKYKLEYEDIAYMGDDVNDLEVLRKVGLSFTVNDGMDNIKKVAKYITKKNGGQGAVREVVELILSARGCK